jgi:LysM repeat protein
MNRDEDIEAAMRRLPADEGDDSEPVVAPGSGERVRRARPSGRPGMATGPLKAPITRPPAPTGWQPVEGAQRPSSIRVPPPAAPSRRGPTYPAWEKPPSPYTYPRLRGREERRTVNPLLLAAIGVALLLGALVVYSAIHGRGGNTAAVSGSPTHLASGSPAPVASGSGQPTPSAVASQDNSTPRPVASFQQYKVQTGDRLNSIAKKFGLQPWELLLANPQLQDNPNLIVAGKTINIPLPGQLTQPPATPAGSPTAPPAAP